MSPDASTPTVNGREYISYAEAAALASKSRRQIMRWVKGGKVSVTGVGPGPGRKIVKSSLLAYVVSDTLAAEPPKVFLQERLSEQTRRAFKEFLAPIVREIVAELQPSKTPTI